MQFTERARQVLRWAREEAARLHHPLVGTEHLLLALIRTGRGTAATLLTRVAPPFDALRERIEKLCPEGETGADPRELPYSSRIKHVLHLATREARSMDTVEVGTEHLLLGLLRETHGGGGKMLRGLNITPAQIRQELLSMVRSGEKGSSSSHLSEIVEQVRSAADASVRGTRRTRKNPTLDRYARDLTFLAHQGQLDPMIGRHREVQRLIEILGRRRKCNPVLVGEPGVGKTAIVEGLAQMLVDEDLSEGLASHRVLELDLAGLVAGSSYRGAFEDRLKRLLGEARDDGRVWLFVDEVHTLVSAGTARGGMGGASLLKPALARGEVKLIGATTPEEYRKHIEPDGAFSRRLQPLRVSPPSPEQAVRILQGVRGRYEEHHGTSYSDRVVHEAVELAGRYLSDRQLPDTALDVLDEAGARAQLRSEGPSRAPGPSAPPAPAVVRSELGDLEIDKQDAVLAGEFERAARLRDRQEARAREVLHQDELESSTPSGACEPVTLEHVHQVVSRRSGVPVGRLSEDERERLLHLEEELGERVVGQPEAVSAVARAVRRGHTVLRQAGRPVGTFLFAGPTGVGKTELARTLARSLYGRESLIRIDMSEYMEAHAVSRLTGAAPGYVGYEEGGSLIEQVRRRPHSVVLFDEMEKAHPDVLDLLLQLVDEGRLTGADGRVADFCHAVVILTSNLGTGASNRVLGFDVGTGPDPGERIREAVERALSPELLNRLDETVIFRTLDREDLADIVRILARPVADRLATKGVRLDLTDGALDRIVQVGSDDRYGARPLRRTIQRLVTDPLSERLLDGSIGAGDVVRMEPDGDGRLRIRVVG